MNIKIAIASGKGGTGKTTVAVNLFNRLARKDERAVRLIDCDVEEPNDAIFLPDLKLGNEQPIFRKIPAIDRDKCTYCGRCASFCEFNAITIIPGAKYIQVDTELCHACGACAIACLGGAISKTDDQIGNLKSYHYTPHGTFVEGRLKIGSMLQTMVIRKLKQKSRLTNGISIYDAPPGTSCPVVETVMDMNYVILVTEPTPFGLHDMKLMVALLRQMHKPFGVVVNKAGLGNQAVYNYLTKEQITLLGEIPFNKNYAAKYATGSLLTDTTNAINSHFEHILNKLCVEINWHERNYNTQR